MPKKRSYIAGSSLLIFTSVIWGFGFVAQSIGTGFIGPFSFNGGRFLLGGLILIPLYIVTSNIKKSKYKEEEEFILQKKAEKEGIKNGIIVGLVLTIASNFQQTGIGYTTAGKAGFITALYIIIVPIIYTFFGKKSGLNVWIGVILSVIGMYFLSIKTGLSINKGDLLLLISALVYSIHIITIDKFTRYSDSVLLSMSQFFVAALISFILAFIYEKSNFSQFVQAANPIIYSGILSCGVGYTLQIVAQRDVEPTIASLIMSLEAVFAVIGGMIILHEMLSLKEYIGCILLFTAIILAQLPQKNSMPV